MKQNNITNYTTNTKVYEEIKDLVPNKTLKQVMAFWDEAFTMVNNYILEGNSVILPFNLGTFILKKMVDTRGEMIDYGATNKARKVAHPDWTTKQWQELPYEKRLLVRFTNSHSDGYIYKLIWHRPPSIHKYNKYIRHFTYKAHRANFSRKLASKLKDGDYPLVEVHKYKTK